MMKRILLTFIIALTASSFMFGQDLYLTWGGKKLADTVYVWGLPTTSPIIFNAIFHNDSDNGMNVRVIKKELSMLDSTMSTFCWTGSCYAPEVDTSDYLFIPAGGVNDTISKPFSGDYDPKGVIGTSIIKYTFYNKDNPDQRVEVVAKFRASPDGIAEDAMQNGSVSNIYPNPATNFVSIDYHLTPQVNSASVKIFNLLGSTVKETVMEKGGNRLKVDVSNLKNGVYFYAIVINGNIYKTKKLLIQH